jgi:predicted CoA-binding protein
MQDGNSTLWVAPINTKETIDAVLSLKTWAVVGLSDNTERAAFGVARLLQDKGHQIIPVHPKGETVHGEIGYTISWFSD